MTRFRPKFSVRTLAVFVTLVCVYFGAWEATKRYGVPAVNKHVHNPELVDQDGKVIRVAIEGSWYYFGDVDSPAPFVVSVQRYEGAIIVVNASGAKVDSSSPHTRKTYLWLFGIIYPREVHQLPEWERFNPVTFSTEAP